MPSLPREELRDLALVALLAGLVPLGWALFFGWRGEMVSAGDAYLYLYNYRHLVEAGGSWQARLYDARILGGVAAHGTWGTPLIYIVCAKLGLAPTAFWNVVMMTGQILLSFFTVKAASSLSQLIGHPVRSFAWRAVGAGLFAFLPFLADRISNGHALHGQHVFLAILVTILMFRTGTATVTALLLAVFAIVNALHEAAFQMTAYGAIFGAPMLLFVLVWRWREVPVRLAPIVGTGVAAGALVLPGWFAMVGHYFGGGTSRVGGGRRVGEAVYSYGTVEGIDYPLALVLNAEAWTRSFAEGFEYDYAIGPMVLLLALLPAGRARLALIATVALPALASMVLCLNIQPFSTWLLRAVPPLDLFRVPIRSMFTVTNLVFLVGWLAVGIRLPSLAWGKRTAGLSAGAVVAFCVCWLLPAWGREAAVWAAGAALLVPRVREVALLPLAGVAVAAYFAAFGQRLADYQPRELTNEIPEQLQAHLRQQHPELFAPLSRTDIETLLPGYRVLTAPLIGLSTLDGYWIGPRRYVELEASLARLEPNPRALIWTLPRVHLGREVLLRLYNFEHLLVFEGEEPVVLDVDATTPGPAWFPTRVQRWDSIADLGTALLDVGASRLTREIRSTLHVAEDDAQHIVDIDPRCASGQLAQLEVPWADLDVLRAVVRSPADCVLVLSLGYTHELSALWVDESGSRELVVSPAYGTLTAVEVPRGEGRLVLFMDSVPAWLALLSPLVGAGVLVVLVVPLLRRRLE